MVNLLMGELKNIYTFLFIFSFSIKKKFILFKLKKKYKTKQKNSIKSFRFDQYTKAR